jgi:hypothetical protein
MCSSRITMGTKHMSTHNVEKIHINIRNVGKLSILPNASISTKQPSLNPVTFSHIEGCILERNLMCVSSVGKPSLYPVSFYRTKQFTQERNPTYVKSVRKPSLDPVTFRDIKELTVQRNLMCVSSVGKPSLCPVPFFCTK